MISVGHMLTFVGGLYTEYLYKLAMVVVNSLVPRPVGRNVYRIMYKHARCFEWGVYHTLEFVRTLIMTYVHKRIRTLLSVILDTPATSTILSQCE